MKMTVLTMLLTGTSLIAQNRYVTVAITTKEPKKIIEVKEHEAITIASSIWSNVSIRTEKDGQWYLYSMSHPYILAGPARLELQQVTAGGGDSLITFEYIANTYPVDKTLVIPKGDPGGKVQLESSIDLVNWAPATNGLYTFPTDHRFFRIKLEKAP